MEGMHQWSWLLEKNVTLKRFVAWFLLTKPYLLHY